jgi:restriction system protein
MAKANYVTVTSDKSKRKALLLCIFAGYLGAHYFYVGRTGKGILYLCTMGLCMFGWLFDIRKIRKGTFKDNVGQYLRA